MGRQLEKIENLVETPETLITDGLELVGRGFFLDGGGGKLDVWRGVYSFTAFHSFCSTPLNLLKV